MILQISAMVAASFFVALAIGILQDKIKQDEVIE